MSHDPTSLLDALGQIPKGASLRLTVTNDCYPTPVAVLTRSIDRGDHFQRFSAAGHGANESLEVAIAQAISEAVADLGRQHFEEGRRQEREAIAREKAND